MHLHYNTQNIDAGSKLMAAIFEVESTLTDRYQTTVPEMVRRVLGLGKRDKIHYEIRANGEVVIARAQASEEIDPVIERFLEFMASDMARHPERLMPISTALPGQLNGLIGDVQVDLDAPLSDDDE